MKLGQNANWTTALTFEKFFLGHLKYLFPLLHLDCVVVAANTLTSLQSGQIINGNPVTSSSIGSTSAAVGRGAAAWTTTRGATLADRRVQAVDDDACDMMPEWETGDSLGH